MFVYFGENGDIKSITPVANPDLEGLRSAEFSTEEATPFLKGTKNIHRYAVVQDKETEKYKFVSKESEKSQISTVNRFLTEVTDEYHDDHDILIEHDVRRKHIRVTMSGTTSTEKTKHNKSLVTNIPNFRFYFTLNQNITPPSKKGNMIFIFLVGFKDTFSDRKTRDFFEISF